MKILDFKVYLDGGTVEITTDCGVFCFDDRIHTTTEGKLYWGQPKDDNSNMIKNSEEFLPAILEALNNK